MKKVIIFVGIAIALCSVLVLLEVGLNKDENDVKSFEKPKNSANIQSNENVLKANQKVFKVDYTIIEAEDNEFMVIYGYDKDGNAVWKYETEKIYMYTETQNIVPNQEFSIDLLYNNEEKVYINDNYTIKALDFQTGKVVWECPNVQCLDDNASYLDIDTKTLYLYSPTTNFFYAIDSNGKMIKEINIVNSLETKRIANSTL